MPFWSTNFGNLDENLKDPKRQFRFYINIQGITTENGGALIWYAKQVNKPTFTVEETSHKYLNHTYYYPGKCTWNEIDITMVDPGQDPDVAATLASIAQSAGYKLPTTPESEQLTSMSKQKATSALGQVKIVQIDSDGKPIETWTLWNAFVREIDFGGTLAYGTDDLVEVKLKLRYDWAQLDTDAPSSAGPPEKSFFNIQ
tara:strand:+ start:907 stop:1506 length:600 start_codon:yes stop_codon:yes gene_type:complete